VDHKHVVWFCVMQINLGHLDYLFRSVVKRNKIYPQLATNNPC